MVRLSVAVGALFAGSMFSRDPEAFRAEHSFEPIHALFTPFVFLDIGFAVDVEVMFEAILSAPRHWSRRCSASSSGSAVIGPEDGWRTGALMGVSMVPRAEIALIVARLGNRLGEWAVPGRLYGALVLVSIVTEIARP